LLISNKPNQTLTRKLLIKLIQRIGLTYLPPRVATWRYQRGSRSLMQNLQGFTSILNTTDDAVVRSETSEDDATDDIPPEMEDVIERLLASLRDKDTVVFFLK
jgi:hypothetical protein